MSFWKTVFGVKESPPPSDTALGHGGNAEIAEKASPQPSTGSNLEPHASLPMPDSLHDALVKGDIEKVKALLKDNPDLVPLIQLTSVLGQFSSPL